ncbi:MAG: FolC bifunctional protein [Planctomycetaceae bacterium]|nr:FolC bifunctional protein [Planctomycetaceae bacterium]
MPSQLSTYQQALEFLYNRINYERVQSSAYSAGDFKLNRMRGLLETIGNPQERIPAVHIAGTKGKGSTAVMIASILQAAGYRVGLFTSPHISKFEERMTVNGIQPSETEIVALVNELLEPVGQLDQELGGMSPTYFEITTAMAWQFFAQQQADIVVLEVGLGGRLDATNVCKPEVCVITSISRDHTHLLGSEFHQIAREKAGIVKTGVPVISGVVNSPAQEVIAEVCQQRDAPLSQLNRDFHYRHAREPDAQAIGGRVTVRAARQSFDDLPLPLIGEHQAHNATLAVMAISELADRGWKINIDAIRFGLEQVQWPARIEVVGQNPLVIVDAAHNWASISALIQTLDEHFPEKSRIAIFAATRDKDVQGMLRQLLPRFDTVILTCYQSNPRSVPVEQLFAMTRTVSDRHVHLARDPQSAWNMARKLAGPQDLICITGSFFIAAEVRELLPDVTPV